MKRNSSVNTVIHLFKANSIWTCTLIIRDISDLHETEKLKCKKCDYSCPKGQEANLKIHVERVHENKKPFECDECEKAYGQNRELKNHKKTAHPTDPFEFECPICKTFFAIERYLKKHNDKHHKK